MNQRERLMAPFKGLQADQPAWLVDLGYWHSAAKIKGILKPEHQGVAGLRRLHEELGVCCYYSCGARAFNTVSEGFQFSVEEKDGIRISSWKTAKGEISDKWQYIEQSYCWAHTEYAVKTIEDLAIVREIYEHTYYEGKEYDEALDAIGDSGVPICPFVRSPLPALLTDWCGVANTIYFTADAPDEIEETLRVIEQTTLPSFDLALKSNAELFHFCDNLDSSASAPYFDQYMRDYYTKRLKQVHNAGKFAVVHLDGAVKGLIGKLASCGFDGIESITPAPVGDIEIDEIRDLADNPDTVIWGGVPGAMFCAPWQEKDIIKHTEHLLQTFAGDNRLVVGSADQIPPNGNLDFVKAVARTIRSFGA